MLPYFNIAGPCIEGEHYMLPPERRLGEALELIEERRFFTLAAGRQTGKTTCLRWIERHLNATGKCRAVWIDLQTARDQPDVARAMAVVMDNVDRTLRNRFPSLDLPDAQEIQSFLSVPATTLRNYLRALCAIDSRPWVVLFDEADCLVGEAMVSFLSQLRDGYVNRDSFPFPSSVVLVGQRQVRDYVLREEDRRAVSWLGSSSPFNITVEPLTIRHFTAAEVEELLQQHTTATGQRFEPEAIARIFELGQGHPWLTNAMADQIVRRDLRDRTKPITAEHVESAKETIILERRTHIDSLVARLREDRVRRVIDPMMAGERVSDAVIDDDVAYAVGLGLIRRVHGVYQVANPVYREVIPRAMTYVQQGQIMNEPAWYVRKDGTLDMDKLMRDWQKFWRKDGHLAAEGFSYRESGPHLMLMAFLQRVINGGGRIEREYGLGRGALDLLVEWKDQRHAIELKLRRDTETEQDALDQLASYLDRLELPHGWLVLFDLRQGPSWQEKLYRREVEHAGKKITIIGS